MHEQGEMSLHPQPHISPQPISLFRKTFRCILVKCDNHRRQGKYGKRSVEAFAVVFPSGRVSIDSDELPRRAFENVTDLAESLGMFGSVTIDEIGEVEA